MRPIEAHTTPDPREDDKPHPTAPPIEDERGPQAPIREPEPGHEPARAGGQRVSAQ